MRNTITRTVSTVYADSLVFENGKVVQSMPIVPATCKDTASAEKYIRKHGLVSGKLISVEKLSTVDQLYGMEEADFIKYAHPVAMRSKETRNMISKNVETLVGSLVYMDVATREIREREITIPANYEKRLDKFAQVVANSNEKGITIENVHRVSALYVISESDFIAHSKKMVDHQHFAE